MCRNSRVARPVCAREPDPRTFPGAAGLLQRPMRVKALSGGGLFRRESRKPGRWEVKEDGEQKEEDEKVCGDTGCHRGRPELLAMGPRGAEVGCPPGPLSCRWAEPALALGERAEGTGEGLAFRS